jgi:soluble lytic murein transglycosylase-like protein
VAAGAYWAARSYLVSRKPEKVNPLLAIGAAHPRTFYGLLSARLLGTELGLRWQAPPLSRLDAELLLKMASIKRVIALAAAGRHDLADLELKGIYLSGREALGAALVGLANRLEIPATQLRLARSYASGGGRAFDAALFPMPPWEPEGGYLVDRALIYAFMRQESAFVVKAKSQAGAQGLMQLMPKTASFVANDSALNGRDKHKLLAPEFNIALGQRYLTHLLASSRVRGNLFHLAIAYNSGPTKLGRWLKGIRHGDDPLLFIESIPSRETRFFVERVLSNFWIYRERLRQDTPSLDAVATGHWPIYLTLDEKTIKLAQRNARR